MSDIIDRMNKNQRYDLCTILLSLLEEELDTSPYEIVTELYEIIDAVATDEERQQWEE